MARMNAYDVEDEWWPTCTLPNYYVTVYMTGQPTCTLPNYYVTVYMTGQRLLTMWDRDVTCHFPIPDTCDDLNAFVESKALLLTRANDPT